MILPVNLGKDSYNITLKRGALREVNEVFNLQRKVLVLTDSGVPKEYAEEVWKAAKKGTILTIDQGEESKSLNMFKKICAILLEKEFTRKDCIVAVGGGVVGDLAGFTAACYMRGIDFYNIPTTLLSQVDSSVGGKTGVDFEGYKNIIGAFHQPKGVIIDPDVLQTLDHRQLACGAAEMIKMAITCDADFFEKLEKEGCFKDLEKNIEAALKIKIRVVEEDEKEEGLRRVLNFGHTLGHGIESNSQLLHGECVALGMLPLCQKELRERLVKLLEREGLPTTCKVDAEGVIEAAMHDKKADQAGISAVLAEKPGNYQIASLDKKALMKAYQEVFS